MFVMYICHDEILVPIYINFKEKDSEMSIVYNICRKQNIWKPYITHL